jgi:hypothetical protein
MHNGVVAGFMQIRRRLLAELGDAAYNAVQSFHSDSAVRWAAWVLECWRSGVAHLMEG